MCQQSSWTAVRCALAGAARTHEASQGSPREQRYGLPRVLLKVHQDHTWCQCGDTHGKQEAGLLLLRTYLPPLSRWYTFHFSGTASKLLSESLLSPTSKCCLGKSAVVTFLLRVWPQVQLWYPQVKPQDTAAPLLIQKEGKPTGLHSYTNLQSRQHYNI